jgi:hypothetical protein
LRADAFARELATRFPGLQFRSGNAEGSAEAFSRGIAAVDARRFQVVAPYASHRKSIRYTDALYDSTESLSLFSVYADRKGCRMHSRTPGRDG